MTGDPQETEPPAAGGELDAVLVQLAAVEPVTADATAARALFAKLKPEHVAALIELRRQTAQHAHEVRLTELKARAEADAARLRAEAEADAARLRVEAEQMRAGPRFVLLITVAAFVFVLAVSAIFLWLQKSDLLPQIVTATLGLVTGLAGGYGIGRSSVPTAK